MPESLNLREFSCPDCGSTIYMKDLVITEKSINFDIKCCGVGCNYLKHVIRKRRDRKEG